MFKFMTQLKTYLTVKHDSHYWHVDILLFAGGKIDGEQGSLSL